MKWLEKMALWFLEWRGIKVFIVPERVIAMETWAKYVVAEVGKKHPNDSGELQHNIALTMMGNHFPIDKEKDVSLALELALRD